MKKIEKLYIYEIEGKIDSKKTGFYKGYIGCWNEADFSYLFFSKPAKPEVDSFLSKNPEYKFLSFTELDYDQWEPSDSLKPFSIPPLSFVPAWMKGNEDDPMEIQIDPGVVFGGGTHETTHRCIEFLIEIMKKEKIESAVDLGTGTGILALTAAKLGVKEITAVDNNNLAVETAVKNVKNNDLDDRIKCICGDAADYMAQKTDLVLANIILWELEKMFIPGKKYGGKWYIISGLKLEAIDRFREIIKDFPFEIIRHEKVNLWSTLLLKRVG